MTGDAGLERIVGRLGRRVIARQLTSVGLLADAVTARRTVHAAMPLLAVNRSRHARVARAAQPEPEPAIPVPPGMSEWAARWLFGDEPVEGIPFNEGAAFAQHPAAPAPRAPAAPAPVAPEARPRPQRGTVDEVHGIRLSRTPAPAEPAAQPTAPPPPATEPAAPASEAPAAPPPAGAPAAQGAPAGAPTPPARTPVPLQRPANTPAVPSRPAVRTVTRMPAPQTADGAQPSSSRARAASGVAPAFATSEPNADAPPPASAMATRVRRVLTAPVRAISRARFQPSPDPAAGQHQPGSALSPAAAPASPSSQRVAADVATPAPSARSLTHASNARGAEQINSPTPPASTGRATGAVEPIVNSAPTGSGEGEHVTAAQPTRLRGMRRTARALARMAAGARTAPPPAELPGASIVPAADDDRVTVPDAATAAARTAALGGGRTSVTRASAPARENEPTAPVADAGHGEPGAEPLTVARTPDPGGTPAGHAPGAGEPGRPPVSIRVSENAPSPPPAAVPPASVTGRARVAGRAPTSPSPQPSARTVARSRTDRAGARRAHDDPSAADTAPVSFARVTPGEVMLDSFEEPLRPGAGPRVAGRPAAARATLRLLPRAAAAPPAPPETPEAGGEGSGATAGARLAAATGALLARQPDGTETVLLDTGAGGPAGAVSAPGAAGPPAAVASSAAAPSAPAAGLPAGHPPRLTGSQDAVAHDELYETLITRLRRDLLAERERVGDLLGPRW